MATEVVMPRLSDTMDSGTIARWHKHEGDAVKRGEVIAEIETDKANMDLESYANGVLAKIVVAEGASAALGQPIAIIAADENEARSLQDAAGDQTSSPPAAQDVAVSASGQAPAQVAFGEDGSSDVEHVPTALPTERVRASANAGRSVPRSDDASSASTAASSGGANGRIKASPLARRLAHENNIELSQVTGSGPSGRITKEDVLAFVQRSDSSPAPGTGEPAPVPHLAVQPATTRFEATGLRGAQPVEMTRMQRTIARRMAEAKSSAPEFVLTSEVDMTEARALLRGIAAADGAPRVGPNDLLIKAVASALQHHPEVNSGWENDNMVRYERVNVGFAVAIEGGLVVPVIQDVGQKSLGAIAREAKALIEKARGNKLMPQEYEGGTFSISNLGMYGIDQFTPIINPPEACILGVGSIVQKPVVVAGEVVVRARMRLTLSCDHRVVNGAQGAEFLRTLRRMIEQPMLTLL